MSIKTSLITNNLTSYAPYAMLNSVWIGMKNRLVVLIAEQPSKAALGLVIGAGLSIPTTWIINCFFQKWRDRLPDLYPQFFNSSAHVFFKGKAKITIPALSPQEHNLVNRLKTLQVSHLLIPAAMALWSASSWKQACFTFPFITVGFATGAQAIEQYNKNNDKKIHEFVQWLKDRNQNIDVASRLDLSFYLAYLRYWNLTKLRQEVIQQFGSCSLVLRSCGLTNHDLRRLQEAGWFNDFTDIDVSDNPQLTAEGLRWIGESRRGCQGRLDISCTDLTDDDLTQMAASGCFNHLTTLVIRDNPRITGRGLVQLGSQGFENLQTLDIGGNSQLLGEGLNEWINDSAFEKLKALRLSDTSVTEHDLEQLIDRSEWFRDLHGLDLDRSANLHQLPDNILKMAKLDTHGIFHLGGREACFRGSGLFLRHLNRDFVMNEGFTQLAKAGKIFTNILSIKFE